MVASRTCPACPDAMKVILPVAVVAVCPVVHGFSPNALAGLSRNPGWVRRTSLPPLRQATASTPDNAEAVGAAAEASLSSATVETPPATFFGRVKKRFTRKNVGKMVGSMFLSYGFVSNVNSALMFGWVWGKPHPHPETLP